MKRLAAISLLFLSLVVSGTLSAQDIHTCADRYREKTHERIYTSLYHTYSISTFRGIDEEFIKRFPFTPPTTGIIRSGFGYRRNPFTSKGIEFHRGIDIQNEVGTIIRTTASGTVVYSGYAGGYGNMVEIEHTDVVSTIYAHLKVPLVLEGQEVEKGDIIGLMGCTGRTTGPHLHYEIVINGESCNPEFYWRFALF
jgi:murein DD-endopeptidase MepM/ murein hydrolase activator NlpD